MCTVGCFPGLVSRDDHLRVEIKIVNGQAGNAAVCCIRGRVIWRTDNHIREIEFAIVQASDMDVKVCYFYRIKYPAFLPNTLQRKIDHGFAHGGEALTVVLR